MFRNLIDLIEHESVKSHVWHGTTKENAQRNLRHPERTEGDLGYGFYVKEIPSLIEEREDGVILEYSIEKNVRILDLNNRHDRHRWQRYENEIDNPHLWKILVSHGIDGVTRDAHDGICIFNLGVLKFDKVYSGVIDDPLSDMDTNELDEFALGGLRRCTSVTVNALLKDFHQQPITLNEVPVDNPGVLNILTKKGLAYRPYPQGRGMTVLQFVNTHRMNDWYLLTPSHAMALIRGELFDAENKGPDARRIQAAFQITRR